MIIIYYACESDSLQTFTWAIMAPSIQDCFHFMALLDT